MKYSSTVDSNTARSPGTFDYSKSEKCLKVICGRGTSVLVYKIGLEGKKVMSASEFYNGFLSKVKEKNYFV